MAFFFSTEFSISNQAIIILPDTGCLKCFCDMTAPNEEATLPRHVSSQLSCFPFSQGF